MKSLRRSLLCLLACTLLPTLAGAAEAPPVEHKVDAEKKPWTSLDVRYAPRDFQFAVITDNTGGPRPGIFREAMEKAEMLQPAFIMSVGDLVDGYVDTEAELDAQWDEFMGYLEPLSMPFFFVPGNHDVGRPLWHQVYQKRVGPTYYYFLYQDVLFLCLDTNDGQNRNTGMSDAQLAWAKEVLEEHKDVRWTLVFQHKPLWFDNEAEWAREQPLFEGRKCTVFAGHIHEYVYEKKGNVEFVTMATTGGGSGMRGTALGEFDHLMWVTITDEGPKMAALELDGILPANFRDTALAQELMDFQRGTPIAAAPIIVEGGTFTAGATTLNVKNPSKTPLRFKALVEALDGILVTPSVIESIVEGGETLSVDLKLAADKGIELSKVQPVYLHWSGAYDQDNAPALKLNGQCRIMIDGMHSILPASGITVDGKLSDWASLPFEVRKPASIYTNEQAWKGANDATFKFATAYDDQYLYVAIECADDQVVPKGYKQYQEFALVYVNALLKPDAAKEEREKAFFSVAAGPGMSEYDMREFSDNAEAAPEGILRASTATDSTHSYEFAIPVAWLDTIQGGNWKNVQLNVAVNDHDPSDARLGVSVMFWRPQWESRNMYPQAGIFEKH
ncbi:MAG: metallophosphoesterase [Candidatus Hydrogenedentes bacterium]|nr:metallophosphoesterase [Candidatus Hydrogenedentota bacterium]